MKNLFTSIFNPFKISCLLFDCKLLYIVVLRLNFNVKLLINNLCF